MRNRGFNLVGSHPEVSLLDREWIVTPVQFQHDLKFQIHQARLCVTAALAVLAYAMFVSTPLAQQKKDTPAPARAVAHTHRHQAGEAPARVWRHRDDYRRSARINHSRGLAA